MSALLFCCVLNGQAAVTRQRASAGTVRCCSQNMQSFHVSKKAYHGYQDKLRASASQRMHSPHESVVEWSFAIDIAQKPDTKPKGQGFQEGEHCSKPGPNVTFTLQIWARPLHNGDIGRGKRLRFPCENLLLCQDRLGTHIRKTQKGRRFPQAS